MTAPTPARIRELVETWTDRYHPQVWVIEKNAFQLFLSRDEQIRTFLANKGVTLREHFTGSNKLDPDFGVASLAPLFEQKMIELPSSHNHQGTKNLIEQLITWQPGMKPKDLKQDLPMALWFAEIIAREVEIRRDRFAQPHRKSKYVPRYRQRQQVTVRLDEYATADNYEYVA